MNTPEIIIGEGSGGLGDLLKFSTIIEIYAKMGYDVYFHPRTAFRNQGIKQLIDCNPYLKGYKDGTLNAGFSVNPHEDDIIQGIGNYISKIEYAYFGKIYNKYPKIYYQPKILDEYRNVIYADFNTITAREPKDLIENYAKELYGDIVMEKHNNIFEYIDIISSCKRFLCCHSGGFNVASRLNLRNTTCIMSDKKYGEYAEPRYPHLNWVFDNIEYMSISGKIKPMKPLGKNGELFDYDEIKELKIESVQFNGYKIVNSTFGVQGTNMVVPFIDPLKKIIFNKRVFATCQEAEFNFETNEIKTLVVNCIKNGSPVDLIFNEGDEIVI